MSSARKEGPRQQMWIWVTWSSHSSTALLSAPNLAVLVLPHGHCRGVLDIVETPE